MQIFRIYHWPLVPLETFTFGPLISEKILCGIGNFSGAEPLGDCGHKRSDIHLGFDPIWIEDGFIKTNGPTHTEQVVQIPLSPR